MVTLNGVQVINGEKIDLSSLAETNILEIVATDNAGNSTIKSFTFEVSIVASVDVNPNILNLKSNGRKNSATTYIELPKGYDISNIDLTKIKMNVNGIIIYAQLAPTATGDYDNDGVADLIIKLDR